MIIGLSGKRKAGKTTAADTLVERYPTIIHPYSFAYPIKEACRLIFGWDDDRLYGELKEEIDPDFGVSSRFAQQTLGTEWGRDTIHPDLWILIAQKYYDSIHPHEVMLIQDVRFDNEYDFIKRNGGLLFSIYNPRVDENEYSTHASENSLTCEADFTISNDCDLPEYKNRVDLMVSQYCQLKEFREARAEQSRKWLEDLKESTVYSGTTPDFSNYVGY